MRGIIEGLQGLKISGFGWSLKVEGDKQKEIKSGRMHMMM